MSDYRSYYDEEEKPAPRPGGRWLIGLIIGLILGGGIGFVVGSGMNGDIGRLGFADGGFSIPSILMLIIITIAAVAVKRARLATSGDDNIQSAAMRRAGVILALILALGISVFFLMGR